MTVTFDAAQYKQTTRAQWEQAPPAWHAWGPTLEEWLGQATAADARRRPGAAPASRVLDVAAGAGGQTLAAAERVGPGGEVLATDISPAILAYAAAAAAAAGLANVRTRELDGEQLDVEPAAFDAVISRLGLIYLPDQPRALAGIVPRAAPRRAGRRDRLLHRRPQRLLLRSGVDHPSAGRAAAAGAGPAGPVQPRRARRAGRPARGGRVPRRRRPGRCRRRCGCRAPRTACGSSASRSARCTRCWPGSPRERARPGRRSRPSWRRFEGPDGFAGPCELLVGWGTK